MQRLLETKLCLGWTAHGWDAAAEPQVTALTPSMEGRLDRKQVENAPSIV